MRRAYRDASTNCTISGAPVGSDPDATVDTLRRAPDNATHQSRRCSELLHNSKVRRSLEPDSIEDVIPIHDMQLSVRSYLPRGDSTCRLPDRCLRARDLAIVCM
jgi:hypothetical protein